MKLDTDFIRSQYPVFTNPETARWAMFENAGGSYVPRQVIDRLHDFFQFTKVQPYGPFEASIKAGEAMEAGYRAETGSRAATIAFMIDGMRCSDAVKRLVEKDIAVRNGHFYALRCLEALGIRDTDEGIIRISLVHYNTSEEVDRLMEGIKEL